MKKLFTRAAILFTTCFAFSFNGEARIVSITVGNGGFPGPSSIMDVCVGDTMRFYYGPTAIGTHNFHIVSPIDSVMPDMSTVADSVDYVTTSTGTYNYICDYDANGAGQFVVRPITIVNLGADITQCGGTAILDAGSWFTASYSWSSGGNAQTENVSASGIYYVDVNSTCGNSSDTISVTIDAMPVVDLGQDATQCGGTVSLDAGNVGSSYTWSDASTNQMLNVSSSGTYWVIVSNFCGNDTDTVSVTINSNPVVNLGADVTQCGGTVMLDAGNVGSTYLWSDASTSQTDNVSSSGTYYVDVTDTNGCMASDTVMVTINVLPTINAGSNVTICSGNSATLTATGGVSYVWAPAGQTTASIIVTPTVNSTYTVTGTNASGCSNTAMVTVNINAGVNLTTSSTPATCPNSDGTATATPSGGSAPYAYSWSGGQTTQTVTGLAAGSYSVCVTDALGCQNCSIINVTSSGSSNLQTTFAAGNAQNGNMFDITAINNITITGIDAHLQATTDYIIYYKAGTFVGFENNAAAWTLAGGVSGVVAQTSPTPTPIPIALNLTIPAGQTYALYATCSSVGISQNYTNGTAVGNIYVQDANVQILEGKGNAYPFGTSYPTAPPGSRIWNGILHYCAGPVGTQDNTISFERGVNVYPNPLSSSATVVISGADIKNGANFILVDVFGKEVKNLKFQSSSFELDRENLSSGIYFYRVNDSNGTVGTGKIVIE